MSRGNNSRAPKGPARPMPPQSMFSGGPEFVAAPEIAQWVQSILSDSGEIYNPDHQHLEFADIAFMWAATGFVKQGRVVLGQCEEVTFRCGPWQKGRQQQQMREWFGDVPDFLITLDASYCAQCSDLELCALVEHELYHIGHQTDEMGAPSFTKEGLPKLGIRGHDVEEFVGVVRRYGAGTDVQRMIDAAKQVPEVAKLNIARACGTCLLKAA